MADSLDVRDEEKLLECAICLSRLNSPRRLDCRHVFCFNCIKNHYKKCGKRLAPCPICRKLYPSMNVTIDNLPQCSIPLDQLLDMKNSRHSCESGPCQSTHAPFLCLGCKKWLCFACKVHDDETAPCPSHEAYRIADIDARLYSILMRSQEKSCVEHPSHELQWFCRQCNILGCNYCKIRQPLNHSFITVNEKAAELRELFKDVYAVMK
ncbi:E3 ubiquitin-protein ligase TRIM56 [Mizuhopecten yessoensis]|uniref:E3 ubiquitin-protein ligase TRIM56 n=1 Tax=Mizuhopecten yessoensis TaxID=6573 RepID=A0A210QRY6_MIZYE|nr:E3 ubiquitin-protein ligase TRIM56 [Mizuhopecten yessoensis]